MRQGGQQINNDGAATTAGEGDQVDKVKIQVKCVGCGNKKIVGKEQVDIPMCDKCYMPMLVELVEFNPSGTDWAEGRE